MQRQLGLWDAVQVDDGWRVRESGRARRLSARVHRDGKVEIVVPRGTRPATVAGFVSRYRDWIERQQRRLPPPQVQAFPPALIELSAVGECWECRLELRAGATRVAVSRQPAADVPGELCLYAPTAAAAPLRTALRRWLATRARLAATPLLLALSQQMDCRFARLQIRRQRTRWGSCSTRGTISVNCCLLFQRPEVLRYLLIHELSHVRHMHHGARFWSHVARFEPDCRTLDRELGQGWRRVPQWALRGGE
jgi:predicted metal-dependent hydrolase